jgi:hypothetical protein
MKMEQTDRSETLSFKLQTTGNNPEEIIRHSKQGESFKSRMYESYFTLTDRFNDMAVLMETKYHFQQHTDNTFSQTVCGRYFGPRLSTVRHCTAF